MERAFDRFIDVRGKSDQDIVLLARSLGIDIGVDLADIPAAAARGFLHCGRQPIQVNYLGYPGTMGAEYMDYLIGDRTVVRRAQQRHYTRRSSILPVAICARLEPHDLGDRIHARGTRIAPYGFRISAASYNSYKITPDTFDGWHSITEPVENRRAVAVAEQSGGGGQLRREASVRGVNADG